MKQLYFKYNKNSKYQDTIQALYKSIINYPPDGYQFPTPTNNGSQKTPTWRKLAYKGVLATRPYSFLLMQALEGESKIPNDVDLTLSTELLKTNKPWICMYDNVMQFRYGDRRHQKFHQKRINKSFTQDSCKKILTWCDLNKEFMSLVYDDEQFKDKIDILRPAVPKKDFKRKYDKDGLQLLFVDTFRTCDFHDKGGKEVMMVFEIMERMAEFKNIKLVIKSNLSGYIKAKYSKILKKDNVILYNRLLERGEMENLYKESDVLLHPTWNGVNAMTHLEAASYEIPTIGVDYWSNTEAIKHGKTGLLIPTYETYPKTRKAFMLRYKKAKRYREYKIRQEVITGLMLAIFKLSDKTFRKKLGKAARKEVEEGKFSLKERNKKLKKIFEEALK